MRSTTLQRITQDGLALSFINEEEFEYLWHESLDNNQYNFFYKTCAPLIINCGAHLSMSVLYFKRCYPNVHVIAFEANHRMFQVLKQNMRQNHIQDVYLINAAFGNSDGEIPFYVRQDSTLTSEDTSLKGANVGTEQQWGSIRVYLIRLSFYNTRPVDYLKLDFERMEETVLREIEEKLPRFMEIRVGFHFKSMNDTSNLTCFASVIDAQCHVLWDAESRVGVREKKGIAFDSIVVAIIGLLASEKSLEVAMESISLVLFMSSPKVPIRFVIVDNGPLCKQLEEDFQWFELSQTCVHWEMLLVGLIDVWSAIAAWGKLTRDYITMQYSPAVFRRTLI